MSAAEERNEQLGRDIEPDAQDQQDQAIADRAARAWASQVELRGSVIGVAEGLVVDTVVVQGTIDLHATIARP